MLLKISNKMSSKSGLENKIIRIPKHIRESLGASIGEFLRFNNDIILQVDQPYTADLKSHGLDSAFVTETTFNMFEFEETTDIEIVDNITLGCDPELFILNLKTGQLASALAYFNKWNPIGADGLLCELRPQPDTDPEVVTSHLQNMISSTNDYTKSINKDLELIGASVMCGVTAGFHCHLGIPKQMLDRKSLNYQKIIDIIVHALDYFVGTLSVIPEGSVENMRRCAPFLTYGKVSDYRVDNRTLEYRVPGGVHLRHPTLTKGLLSLCLAVCMDTISKLKHTYGDIYHNPIPNKDDIVRELYPTIPDKTKLYKLICSTTTEQAENEAPVVYSEITKMLTYNKYRKNIDEFYSSLKISTSNYIAYNWLTKEAQHVR